MKKLYALVILSLAGLAGCGAWQSSDEDKPEKVSSSVDTLTRVAEEKEGYLMDELDTSVDADLDLNFDLSDDDKVAERDLIPTYFDYGKSTFKEREDQEKVCKREAKEAKKAWDNAREDGREIKFVVEGRSCDKGKAKEDYKERIGLRRAETVAAELEKTGIPRSAIEVTSLGSRDSKLADDVDPVMHALNRRTDVRMVEV